MSTSPDPTLLAALLQAAPVGLFAIRDAALVWCNDVFVRLLAIPAERAFGRSFVEFVAPEDRALVVDRYRRRLAGEPVPDSYEFSVLTADGGRIPVVMVARVVTVGDVRYSVGVIADNTAHVQFAAAMSPTDRRVPSAPVLRIAAGVLVVPLIGHLHAARAHALQQDTLAAISAHRAHALILDLTGLVDPDARVADYVARIAAGSRLLGARCLIAGVSAELARTLAGSGTALAGLQTAATLEDAVEMAKQPAPAPG